MSQIKLVWQPKGNPWMCGSCGKKPHISSDPRYQDQHANFYCMPCGIKIEEMSCRQEEIKLRKDQMTWEDKRHTLELELKKKALELEQEKMKTLKSVILDLLIRDKIPPKELAQIVEAYTV